MLRDCVLKGVMSKLSPDGKLRVTQKESSQMCSDRGANRNGTGGEKKEHDYHRHCK